MSNPFQKASKKQARLRAALIGPSGSGKTFTALRVATSLGGKVAVVDTERGSASKYADRFAFDVLELESFDPRRYVEAIQAAGAAGYDVLVIDSLSHAWSGKDGALEMVDNAAKRSKAGNSFGAWREVTPLHNALVDAILRAPCHVIATMRSKTEYAQEKDEKTGRTVVRKVGLAPVQRDGMEYEFDLVGDMDEATLVVTKSRCPALTKAVMKEPGEDLAQTLKAWLTDGAPAATPSRPLAGVDLAKLHEEEAQGEEWLADPKHANHPKRKEVAARLAERQAEITLRLREGIARIENGTPVAAAEVTHYQKPEDPTAYVPGRYHGD